MVAGTTSTVFINEIHYDNDGADVGEFIEIANTEEQDLTGWTIVLYNGNNGESYATIAITGSAQLIALAAVGMQNGAPDGIALVDAMGNVVQFLSYEGSFTATNGPAVGLTSTDIGVSEVGTTPVGQSLQLTGTGSTYGDFTWSAPAAATSGSANTGQSFSTGGVPNEAPVVTIIPPVIGAVTVGGEFLVNTEVTDAQRAAEVTGLVGGGFVVSWQTDDIAQDGSGFAVKAQVFDATGAKVGAEILVNTQATVNQSTPTITGLSNGGFVVSWSTNDGTQDGSGSAIAAQVFDAAGAKIGAEFLVNSQVANTQVEPTITGLINGGFVITWSTLDSTQDGSGTAVKAQVFDATGTKIGGEFLVNTRVVGIQNRSKVDSLDGGGFVVTWLDQFGDSSDTAIKAQLFDSAGGKIGGEFLVNTKERFGQSDATVTGLVGGGFVVSWMTNDSAEDGSGNAIKAQVFDAAGAKVGAEFLVNTESAGSQLLANIAGLEDGGFVVSWYTTDTTQDGDSTAIKAQVFDATGAKVGAEFLVNSQAAGTQFDATAAGLEGGGFVITWETDDSTQDGSNAAIKAHVFAPVRAFNATEQTALDLKGTVTIADPDAGSGVLTATVSVDFGVLDISVGTSGVTIVSGNGTGSVVVEGTLDQLNALFGSDATSTLTYTADGDAPPASVNFSVSVNDNGNTGSGGARTGSANQAIAVTDTPDPGMFSIADASVVEGDSGTTDLTFTVTRNAGSAGAVTVDFEVTLDGTANAADVGALLPSGQLSFADGETSKTFTVTINGDTDIEPDETFSATLSNATGGATISATEGSATGTITNDDFAPQGPATVFINEIHYDNAGADAGEAVEIAGPAGTDLTGWTLLFYNGGDGAVYATINLTGTIPDQDDGFGTLGFTRSGIQNGSPDGFALVDPAGNVVQFLSYEGTLTATSGAAAGLTSEDIGVVEDSATPLGFSLQLTGSGNIYDDFTWATPRDDNFGAVNTGQDFLPANPAGALFIDDASVIEGDSGTSAITFNVFRVGGTTGAVTADFAVQFGTGFTDADASDLSGSTSGTVSFADGETFKTITVNVSGDTDGEPNEFFDVVLSNPTGGATIGDGTAVGTIENNDALVLTIGEIQGAGHTSQYVGNVVTTNGIVTAIASNGFYMQDAGDGNTATSDAIFVFTSTAPTVTLGDGVTVEGTVSEFLAGGDTAGLSTTQLTSPTITVNSTGNALPAAVVIGPNGITPPTETIDDDLFGLFDPASDGIDFWESLEGMLVTIENPVAVDSTNGFGELWTVASDGAGNLDASNVSAGGFVVIDGGAGGLGTFDQGAGSDFNPERIQIDVAGELNGVLFTVPDVTPGTLLGDVTGVVAYAFGNYQVQPTAAVTVVAAGTGTAETTALAGAANQLTVATYNVLNLDVNDADGDADVANGQFAAIAFDIASNLSNPDIIVLQEVQDDSGSADDGTVSAALTLEALSDAIFAESGVRYSWFDNPFITDGQSGGQPGGNIRVAFLYRDDRVDFDSTTAFTITDPDTGALDAAFSGSRPPLGAEFTFNGETITVIGNHWTSKIGSDTTFSANQLPANAGELSRAAQAAAVNAYIDALLAADANANVLVAGDFNEFHFEDPMEVLTGDLDFAGGATSAGSDVVLTNLTYLLPVEERYTLLFEGNAQQLDHILVTSGLADGAVIDIVHTNFVAGPGARASDHDPVLVRLNVGTQTILGDKFRNTLVGNDGDDIIYGGLSQDRIAGEGGNDFINGGPGRDLIFGGAGNDVLRGGSETDSIDGGDGNDIIYGDKGMDRLLGWTGNDVIYGGNQDDVLSGGEGDDRLFGENNADRLFGDAGNDLLDGGNGADWLDGGAGMDTLTGGVGIDTFVLHADGTAADADTITDFGLLFPFYDTILIEGAEGRTITVVQDGADTLIEADGVLVARVLGTVAAVVEAAITYPPAVADSFEESASPYADMAIVPVDLFDPLGGTHFA
ncbi:Calx-beta domain-containing protein [Erythrobacter sp. EC-HK427]|uniref:Calx-beta domain-containing protein n=1 Tax=Erythrobacter sp. EC-HK427 TaxID=2038396 RepID=UPI0012590C99|nr:lamin tail domain-containing protein [Erythrobacter sp. EC-HK427]VVT06316.1 conserved hypothetical protein [Erythrobacter sp. EC-HK427]